MTRRDDAAPSGRLDLRGLDPPEPMRRALEAVEMLGAGGALEIITDREPMLLQRELERRNHAFVGTKSACGYTTIVRRGVA